MARSENQVLFAGQKASPDYGSTRVQVDRETNASSCGGDSEVNDTREPSGVDSSRTKARLNLIFPALAIGIFLAAADQTVIVSSYSRIGSDLDELSKTSWLATAYLCTTTAFQPLYGKLGDIFGRKPCLLFAYSVFGLGALFCGLALDMNQLIIARALTGIGAGGIITTVSILLSDLVSLEERGIWQGYVNMVFACGAGLGAPLGGVLTDVIGWRWAFLIQAPLCAIAVLSVIILLHLPPLEHDDSQRSKLARVDFLGGVSLVTFLIMLLIFLDRISLENYQWQSTFWLVGSVVAFATFLRAETVTANPLMPLRLLFGREFLGAYLALCFGNVAWYGVLFYIPLLYQAVGHFSASAAGTLLLPGIGAGVIGGFIGGWFLKRGGGSGFSRLAFISYPLVTVSCLSCALESQLFWTQAIPIPGLISILSASLFAGGLGNGGGMASTLIVVVAVANPQDQAVVTACVYFYRQLGATIGLALISVVFRRVLTWTLYRRLAEVHLDFDIPELVQRVLESLEYLDHVPADVRAAVEGAYGIACRAALLVCLGLGVCAILSVFFMQEKRKGAVNRM
ncbi:MFS general substrate transporter [Daldinia sp. FL1419]|nr:MFS general substrate transporter [Daldinia sp. FL1419]